MQLCLKMHCPFSVSEYYRRPTRWPSLSESKVTPNFCFTFKIPDDVTASNNYIVTIE